MPNDKSSDNIHYHLKLWYGQHSLFLDCDDKKKEIDHPFFDESHHPHHHKEEESLDHPEAEKKEHHQHDEKSDILEAKEVKCHPEEGEGMLILYFSLY